ncbi:MAG: DUF4411 family protein [Bacteroidales bacterium]|nr:DUF4411 family protein [Bacteroidales bacterium]
MKYIFDTNSFITPHRAGYNPLDVAINFWNKIKELSDQSVIGSIDKVKAELSEHDDDLRKWVNKTLPKDFFVKFETEATKEKFREVASWAQNNTNYNTNAKAKFLNATKADIYLVAFSATYPEEYTVVSFERSAPQRIGEIKLPDACNAFGARCIMMADMFRELKQTY